MGTRRRGPRLLALVAAIAVVGALCAAAGPASARVSVGVGQQSPEIFTNRYWLALRAPDVRYIAPWDVLQDPAQLALLDRWMEAADTAGARVLLGFQHSLRSAKLARVLPKPRQFERAFRGLRARYPHVRSWVPWNEANNKYALTIRRPRRAAQFFDIAARNCRGCQVVAADVLDDGSMVGWLKRFRRAARERPKLWGLHNYNDANTFRSNGIRRLLSTVPGKIWITESGGVVKFHPFAQPGRRRPPLRRYSLEHAARATTHVLDLARISRRVQRTYLYHWRAPLRFTTWDSALMTAHQRPRPAYRALRKWLVRARRRGLAAPGRTVRTPSAAPAVPAPSPPVPTTTPPVAAAASIPGIGAAS